MNTDESKLSNSALFALWEAYEMKAYQVAGELISRQGLEHLWEWRAKHRGSFDETRGVFKEELKNKTGSAKPVSRKKHNVRTA